MQLGHVALHHARICGSTKPCTWVRNKKAGGSHQRCTISCTVVIHR
jgi:hypothetical protein